MSVELGQHLLSGFNSAILSFLENGNAAEVGVGKEYAVIEARQAVALFGENGADGGGDHGVPHGLNPEGGEARTEAGGKPPRAGGEGPLPVDPFFFEEKLAVL